MSPPAVFRLHAPPRLIIPPSAGFHDAAYGLEKGEAGERKWLPFCPSSKAQTSRGQLTNSAAISDGGAGFDGFGSRRGPPSYVT
jgi:hypothetical protein